MWLLDSHLLYKPGQVTAYMEPPKATAEKPYPASPVLRGVLGLLAPINLAVSLVLVVLGHSLFALRCQTRHASLAVPHTATRPSSDHQQVDRDRVKAGAHAPCLLVLEITRCVLDLVHTVLPVIEDGYLLQP